MTEGADELIFSGGYKDFSFGVYFDLSNASEMDVAYALSFISEKIEMQAFRFSGINTEKIDHIITLSGGGIPTVVNFLEKTNSNELRSHLTEAAVKEKLLPAAECYLFSQLLEKAGAPYKITTSTLSSSLKLTKKQPEDQIIFIGKYRRWVAIKKLSVDEETADWEISAILSSINNTVINKAFEFAGIDRNKNDQLISKLASGKRKSYGNAALVLKNFIPSGNAHEDAYTVCKLLEAVGYKPYANPDMLSLEHPEVKGVKIKGRKPKG